MKPYFVLAALAALAPLAAAQQQARPDPADPGAKAPAVKYESAFAGYVPYREQKLAPWREANDEAARIGGHVGLFRGGHAGPSKPGPGQPAASPTREPAGQPPLRSAPQAPHGGHKGH